MNAPANIPGPHIHCDFEQGSERWLQARCGLLTASEFDRILTPTLKIADNVKERAHLWEMAAQRITGYVEPQYISDAMLRGQEDEIIARDLYSKHFAKVEQCGFVTNNKWGFTIGCSPDGLVGDDGLIEVKSRCQKYQIQTLCEHLESGTIPEEYILQVQGELLVTERKWCDFISFCGGLPMVTIRVFPDAQIQNAIVDAAAKFESRINETIANWGAALSSEVRLLPTERTVEEEMVI
jgi:predicted phage-related endonuclease